MAVLSPDEARTTMAMIHKHPSQRKAWRMTIKWGIEFFCKIGLIPSNWLYYNKMYGYTLEQYVEKQVRKGRERQQKRVESLKARGIEYFTSTKYAKIANSRAVT